MAFQQPSTICPICQKTEKFVFVRDHQNKDGRFSLYECRNCGIQFWNPFKGPGKEWYEKEYDFEARNILISKPYRGCHKKFLNRFRNFPSGTRILDIGCGIGDFLAELQRRKAEVWGVDFNRNHTEIASKKFGLKNIYTMDFGEFFKKDLPQFDIVTCFGLLEHIDNPRELVMAIKKIIKLGGIIATSAPSKENLVTGMDFRDQPPDHLSQWNPKAFASLFGQIGYVISHLEYLDQFNSFKSVITGKFRFGLVDKTAKTLNQGGPKKKNAFALLKTVHFLGSLKDYLIGGIPASFLMIVAWLSRRRGASMFVILKSV